MKKLAIIGASHFQNPLILKAKEMGLETRVFAWASGDIGETTADYFYPISIRETDAILEKCKEIGIDGICTIGSDLATVAVNHVAEKLGLPGNSIRATELSTNKRLMREAFRINNIASPMSIPADSIDDVPVDKRKYPLIVKPTDRSGSRGITKVFSDAELSEAIKLAKEQSFENAALVEEFAEGNEYSVESISFKGQHTLLSVTRKYTTGSPNYIETGHIEPAPGIDMDKIRKLVFPALDALQLTNGASHCELKIDDDHNVNIIEIGGSMGGDFIGSDLVKLSTGIDFVEAVVKVALGEKPSLEPKDHYNYSAVRFIFDENDAEALKKIRAEHPELIDAFEIDDDLSSEVTDSSSRHGYFIFHTGDLETAQRYLP